MGKLEKVGKKLIGKSFAFFVVLSIISVFSCEIGLGAAVDVAAPTSGISYPPQNAVVRDTFVAAGICEDDMEVISVKVTVTNTEDNSTYGPYDATLAEDKKSWTITLNNKDPSKSTNVFDSYRQWEIPDGNYVISAVAYDDAEKESPAATLPISIDNTAPVLIVSKPLAVGSEAATEYGRSFTLAGDIAEEHQTSKITLSYREYSGSSFTDSVKSIELSNFGSMSSSNPLVIAKYYNNSVAMNDEKTKLRNTYLNLYGSVDEVNKSNNNDKSFYGAFLLEDNARIYNNPGDSGSGTGNQTSEYYILSTAVSELFGSAYSLDVAKLMQIINGKTTYNAGQISEITRVLNGNKASSTEISMGASSKFTINPNNSPLWAIDGYGVDGYEADKIEEQVNGQGAVTSEGAKKYTAGNILTLTVKAGRDNIYIKPNTVGAKLYQLRKNSSNVYERDPAYNSGNGKVIITEGEWTDPAADSATTQISLDVTEHGLVNDKYYEIEVTGVDRNNVDLEPEAVHYVFKLSSNGAAPIIEFTEGLNRSWKKGADITSSFDITGKIISSTNIITDNVTINSFNVRDNNDATNSITINAHGDTSFGAGSTSAEYPFTIHVTPTSGNLVPSASSKYTYNITIRAEDDATAFGMKTLTLFVDNKNPTLNISGVSPLTANDKVNGKITVRGTVSDNESGLNSLTYKVYKVLDSSNDEEVIAERNITASNSWNFEFNTTELTAEGSGDYKIVIKAVDKVGNETEETEDNSIVIHVDQNTDTPEISLSNATYLLAGRPIEADDIDADHNLFDTVSNKTLYGSVTDDDGIDKVEIMWYKPVSGDWIAFNGPKPNVNKNGKVATFNCQMPSTEGLYTIKIKATDTLSETTKNAKEIEFPVAVNNGAPQFLNISPESSESNYVKGTLTVSGKIKDSTGEVTITADHTAPSGLSSEPSSSITQPGAENLSSTTGAGWSDTITLPDVSGSYSVTYTAENKYHQKSTHTIVYSVDVTVPVLGSPSVNKEGFDAANDYWNNGNVPLKVIVTDAGSGVEKVGYSLTNSDDQAYYEDFTAAGNTWSGNVAIGDSESKEIFIRAVDKKDNAAQTSITVKIDNNAPTLAQTKYKIGTGEAGTVSADNKVYVKADESLTVYGSYSDTPAGVMALSFTLGGVAITPTVTYATKALDDESLVEADFVDFNDSNKKTIKSWKAVFSANSLANSLSDAELVVKGEDYAGNTVTAEGLSLTKDVDAPNIGGIKIISGTDKNAYKDTLSGKYYLRNRSDGAVTIEGSTTDSNLKGTKIVVQGLLSDGTSAAYKIAPDDAVTSSKWSFANLDMNWPENVTGASITITAIDKSGNSTDETINIEFDETKPVLDFTPYNVTNYKFRGQNVVKYSSVKIGQGTYSESSYGQLSSIDFTFYFEEKGSSFSKIQYQLLTADQTNSADQTIAWNDNASDGRRSGTLNVVRGSGDYGYSEYTYYDGETPAHEGLKVSGTISGFTHTQGQNKKNLLLIRAVDNCGNASEPQLLKVLVDQTAPTVEFAEYTGTKVNGNILTNGTSSITLTGTATDVDAGLKALTLSMSGITTPLFTVNNTTNTTISNDYGTFTINGYIDSTKATACSLADAASYVTWTAVITPCEFNDDGSFKQLKTWFSNLASGATPYFTVQAEDWAEHSGNGKKSSNVKIATLLVDKEPPVVTITTPLDKNAAGATALNGNQIIKGTITDANQLVEAKLYVKKTSESSWGDPVKVLTTESAPAAPATPDENTTYNVDVSKLLNFTFSGININDYAANDGTGSADICVIAKDLAGNVTEITSQRAVDIDCDLDRPVITISDVELMENSNPISETNPLMFTTKTVNLSVEDDDGPVAESSYRVKQVVNGSETILTATDTNTEGWTSFDISSTGTAKINLPVNAQNKQIQGKMKIEFKIKDAADAEFETAASTTQGKIKIKDNASTPHTYGTTAANYTDPTLYLLVDTNDPIVTFEGITRATAWTGTSATDTTGFTAYGEEITSSYSDLVLGGTSKYAKIRFSANDDGTVVDTSTAKVEISLDGTPVSDSPFTAVADTSTNATDDFFVIIPCTGDGTFTIKVSAKDNAGKDGQDTKQIKVDNTDPVITITAPSETTYQSGATTGTVKFNEISRLSYAISPIAPQYNAQGKLTNSPDNYTSTTSFSYDYVGNANSPVALSTTGLNTVCGYSTPLETKLKLFYIYFDGDLDSSSNTQIHTSLLNDKIISMGITTASAINSPDNPFSEIVKLYMYIKAEDEAGNMSEGVSTILVDPLGQRPTATIGYPSADGQKLGGAITLMGTATGKNQIEKVYVAIAQSDDDGATWGDYGTEREAELKGSSWSLVINNPLPNGELEFDPRTDDGIKTIKIRVRAKDNTGASSGYEYRTLQIDKDTPVIGQNLTLVQWKTGYNGGNGLEVKTETVNGKPEVSVKAGAYEALRNYTDKMSLGSLDVQWYLIGQVSDNNGIKSVKINGNERVSSAGAEYTDATSGTYVKKLDNNNNYYFCIPIGDSSTGYVGEKTVEFAATENKTSGAKTIPKNFTVKIDNRAPVLVTEGTDYNIAIQLVNNNGFYGFGSVAKEDKVLGVEQTGVERIAFYYTRDTYSDKSLYDVMVKNDADGNKLETTGLIKSEGLYWKKYSSDNSGFVVDGATITLSERDYNIHTGGLAKVNGTIYKVSTVSADGTVITLGDNPGPATEAYFAVANIIDNPTEEGAGRNKLNDIYGWGYYSDASYDDGDYMMEALRESKTATGATYQWKAYINSRNLDDGPVVLHYVAFDKAGNVTAEQTVACTVKNNAPRIAGLKIGTDQNGDGNVTESDGDDNEYITTYHVDVANASTLHENVTYPPQSGSDPSSIITVKGKTVLMPEILGGNGNLYYTFTVAEHDTGLTWDEPYYTDDTATQFGYGTKSDDTHYAYAASGSTAAATINLPVSKFVYQDNIADGNNQKFVFTVKDSTPGRGTTKETTDPQTATLSVVMNVALRDNEAAKNYIMPFYWNSLKDNSVYSSKTPESVADLGGHIELPKDLIESDDFATGVNPKVSGKIKIEGIAHDNNLIKTLKATVNENTYTLASRSASAAATGYLTPATETLANDGWQVSIKKVTYGEYEAAGLGTKPNGKNATDEIGYTTQNYGHNVHWVLTIDTEKLLGDTPVQEDFEISVEAEDVGQPTATSVTADDTSVTWTKNTFWNNAEKQNGQTQPPAAGQTGGNLGTDAHTCKYTVDVVPYIQGLKTHLSTKSGKVDTSEFDRTAYGHYPVGENEKIYIYGFNLKDGRLYDRDGTSVKYEKVSDDSDTLTAKYKGQGFDVYKTEALTSFKSGPVSVKVGSIESLNNKNYNGSKGSYTKAEPIASNSAASIYGAQSTYTAYNNYFYNHTPNQTTNYTLTDDVELDMWHFNPEAAKPNPSGRVDEPIMKINPSSGIIGFAFLSGPMCYSMPDKGLSSYSGTMEGKNGGDYHAGNGFAYDDSGNAYGFEVEGTEGADYYIHMVSSAGTHDKTIIDKAYDTDGGNLRYKLKGASFAATSHDNNIRNFYLAYYNSYRGRIHYRYGTYNGSWSGLLTDDDGANTTANSQVIANGTDSTLGGAGKYISMDVIKGSAANNDIVVLVWYDENANALKYTYNTNPKAGTTGVNTTGWKAAKTIFSGAGEYCQIKLDGAGGVHIAAKNKKGGVKYAYLSSYNALDASNAKVTTYDVDTYGSVGGHLTLDVALDASNKPVPYISYIGGNIAKIAYLKNTARGPGVYGSKFTNNWEVSYIPSSSKIINLDDKEKAIEADSRVSVGVWKASDGKITNSTAADGTNRKNEADATSGTCWGNGTANPVVAYQTQFDDANERIETAQMKN